MNLLTVIPFCTNDAYQAEALIDHIALLRKKQPRGHCLIVAHPDVVPEFRVKMCIAAQVAFSVVDALAVEWPKTPPVGKAQNINFLFSETAKAVSVRYKTPFLWLEPDCVPMLDFVEELSEGYEASPKRFMGAILKDTSGRMAISRVAVYPPDCYGDVKPFCGEDAKLPFELGAMEILVERTAKTQLIQQIKFESTTERAKIRSDAAVVHSDKQGVLLMEMREKITRAAPLLPKVFEDAPMATDQAKIDPVPAITPAKTKPVAKAAEKTYI